MRDTYKTINQNEYRALSLSLYEDNIFNSGIEYCYYSIYDENNNIIIPEQEAYIDGSGEIIIIIGETVTSNTGRYSIIWKTTVGESIYIHKTILDVV